MDPAQNLINQYAQEAQEERTKPAEVLEDAVNEGKEYEKSLLQGVGGLVAGSSVEKGFKQLANSKKGAETLKKLGMSDEDVEQVISAIKGKDASSLTEFLARKGTGYVKNLSKELGGKAKEVFNKLKKGEMPTRQDLEDAINRGGGESVKPTTSNRSSSKALAEDDEDDGLSVFDKLISKGKNAIKGTTKSLEDKLGDIPAKLSKQAQSIGNDARDVVRGAESSVKSISQPNSVFDRARAEFQGDDDLEGQVSAVKKLLSGSKAGRRAIRQNAKDKAEGKKPIRQKKQQTEFDEEDEQGDLLSEATKKIRVKGKAKPVEDEQPIGELNPFTNEPIATPQQKVDALKSKADDELKQAQDQLANEGDRDPYQDVYDKAKMDSERFTPKQSTGEPMKQDLDLKFKAPTEEEAKAQFKAQEQAKPETNKTSFDEVDKTPFKQDVLDDLPDLADVVQDEAPTISVPPSQQTGGLDPSTLPDDAGFQRGSAKIQAKTEVDPPKPPPEAPKPTEPTDTEAVQQQVKEVQQTARTQVDTKPVIEEQPQAPKPPPEAPKPPPKPIRPDDIPNDPLKELDPLDPANRIPKDIPPIGDDAVEEGTSAVKKGLTKAFEDSLDADEDPFGVIVSGVLGIGALIAGAFGKAHHPHFIQPPTSAPYENFSVQEGVA
tara:strand:+ start:85 stop:2067 length:1983 start_codon:yes stop_codon:yes gene_type:complete